MTNSNFKNVKVGQRFITPDGKRFVKIKPCWIEGTQRNAIRIEFGNYFFLGNVAVSILKDDEG